MRRRKIEYKIGHLFGGMGGGAYGAMRAKVAIDGVEATFRTLGSVDIDPESCEDFEMLTGVKATCADVHEMTIEELRVAFQGEMPDMVLLSPPCKGFSRLLGAAKAREPKYQKLNRLVLDGLFLLCNAWDEPPPLIFIENVPGITSRGKELLRKARMLLRSYGYRVTADDYHDCGEIGGLAQHRKRFFMVARCERRVPYYVYQPGKMRVKACGEVLQDLPIPGDTEAGGPLHALPKISWLNWIRLALIPAGGDWRDLPGVVPEGKKRREIHRRHAITKWGDPVPTVTGPGGHAADYVADPRPGVALGQTARGAGGFKGRPGLFGVARWDDPMPTVTASASISGSNSVAAVADPRAAGVKPGAGRYLNQYNVLDWRDPAKTVTGATRPGSGAPAVADPRYFRGTLGVLRWDEPTGVVTGSAAPSRGVFSVADPRIGCEPRAGAYGVLGWQEAAATIAGSIGIDNGKAAIADPRIPELPAPLASGIPENPKRAPAFIPVIIAEDGTWHRPLTTLELAVLQGFPAIVDGKPIALAGKKTTAWRERVGNAIPPPAAQAVASELLLALLASELEYQQLQLADIWVKDQDEETGVFVAPMEAAC